MPQIAQPSCFVGIDIAKQHIDVHVLPANKGWRVEYTPDGLKRLLGQLEQLGAGLIVMEASGGYERACADCLAGAGLAVAIVNPRQVRRLAGAFGQLAKTDQIDAAILARFAQVVEPARLHTPDPAQAMLVALTTRRRQLVGMITMERQRHDTGHTHRTVLAGIRRHVRSMQKMLARLEARIEDIISGHPLWSRISTALQEVKGIGPQTAITVITHMPEIGTLNRREAAALAGLAPINRDSGRQRGRRFVQGGRQQLKTALYLAALSAARYHPVLKDVAQTMRKQGKPPKVTLIAVARRLIVIINATAKNILKDS